MMTGSEVQHCQRKRCPQHGWSFFKNVAGRDPCRTSLKEPKSLHQSSSSETSGSPAIHGCNLTISSALISLVLTESYRCSRAVFGKDFQLSSAINRHNAHRKLTAQSASIVDELFYYPVHSATF